jgi:HlyD family type I secretion membrane fusion protein
MKNLHINYDELLKVIAKPKKLGLIVVLALFSFFILWGGFAELDSSVVGNGSFTVVSEHKVIQHLEGGVIEQINVKDGQHVQAGQVLIKLSDIAAKTRLETTQSQYFNALATEARLIAERDHLEQINYPEEIIAKQDNDNVKKITSLQSALFKNRRNFYISRKKNLAEQIEKLNEQITSIENQDITIAKQIDIINQEIKNNNILLEKKIIEKPRVLMLEKSKADVEVRKFQAGTQLISARQQLLETQMKYDNHEIELQTEIGQELDKQQAAAADLREKMLSAKDVLERTEIKAPYNGIVTSLQYHTIGGVINSGGEIMDIVPQDDDLIVEAKIATKDIDVVHVGLKARLIVNSAKARFKPRIEGNVVYVSADKMTIDNGQNEYFTVKIEVPSEEIEKIGGYNAIYPGMPVEVFISTGKHTMLEYIFTPIRRSLMKSLN